MKRTPLKRKTALKRGRGRKPVDVIMADLWRSGMGACVVCKQEGRACSGRVEGHHIIAKQTLRRRGLHEHLWDHRNRLPVCSSRHELHTTKAVPIPRRLLPEPAFVFARELELEWWIEKNYPAG